MLDPVQVIIHGDQQLGQANGRDLVAEPGPEARNAYFDISTDGFSEIRREVPALGIHGHRGIGGEGGEEAVIGRIEALRQRGGGSSGVEWQPCGVEEGLPPEGPCRLREKEVVKLAKALATWDPHVAALD